MGYLILGAPISEGSVLALYNLAHVLWKKFSVKRMRIFYEIDCIKR